MSRLAVPVTLADRVWWARDPETGMYRTFEDSVPTAERPAIGKWESRYKATCNQCPWTHGPALPKVAVEEQARWHREHHRRGGA